MRRDGFHLAISIESRVETMHRYIRMSARQMRWISIPRDNGLFYDALSKRFKMIIFTDDALFEGVIAVFRNINASKRTRTQSTCAIVNIQLHWNNLYMLNSSYSNNLIRGTI